MNRKVKIAVALAGILALYLVSSQARAAEVSPQAPRPGRELYLQILQCNGKMNDERIAHFRDTNVDFTPFEVKERTAVCLVKVAKNKPLIAEQLYTYTAAQTAYRAEHPGPQCPVNDSRDNVPPPAPPPTPPEKAPPVGPLWGYPDHNPT